MCWLRDLTVVSVVWQVRAITTLATTDLVKGFTVHDRQAAKAVTMDLPHGTLLIGTDKFFGVSPHTRYKHGVEANSALDGDDCMHTKNKVPLSLQHIACVPD